MKETKRGIALITLLITLVVMSILATVIIMQVNANKLFDKADNAVDMEDLQAVNAVAQLAWSDAYLAGKETQQELQKAVEDAFLEKGINKDKYYVKVTEDGVRVEDASKFGKLGNLIKSAADYGKKVDYVSDNGVTDWKVFYHTDDYVYLIASEELAYDKVPTILTTAGVTTKSQTITLSDNTTRTVGQVYWSPAPTSAATIQNPTMWMANWSDYSTNANGRCVSYFLDETHWTAFKNTTATYKDYVIGAIGTPTAEMFVASWNAKRAATNDTTTYNKKLSLVANGTTGYYVNDVTTNDPATSNTTYQDIARTDSLYIWSTMSNTSIWLASPSGSGTYYLLNAINGGYVNYNNYASSSNANYGARPVVCLRSSIPATLGNGDYDFSLVK